MVCSSISIVIVRLKCTIPGVLVLDVMDRKMGDKYTTRSGIAKGPLSTARLKILVPFCLMVFVAWNSSSMVPFGRSSSGPTYGMPVPEYESLGVNTMQRHKVRFIMWNPSVRSDFFFSHCYMHVFRI